MQVAHILRRYNPGEWGGTETAVKRLCDGLRALDVQSIAFCPRIDNPPATDPLAQSGHIVKRFRAHVPVWGVSEQNRRAMISMGGNIISFDLMWDLWRERGVDVIHVHTQNRLGGTGLAIARIRSIPLVVSIHGGVLDLPAKAREHLAEPLRGGIEWGKPFGALLRSRKVLAKADAIITGNRTEAELLRKQYPRQRVVMQPHGIPSVEYERDQRAAARQAFPAIIGKRVLLMAGRIDTVKNQNWVIEQAPGIFAQFPDVLLVIAGSITDEPYAAAIRREICQRGLTQNVLLTGNLPPGDPRLIGLFQEARALVLPSLSEPFGLVILESWASGTPVISSRTSGATDLIKERENGWIFDLSDAAGFHAAVAEALGNPERALQMGRDGQLLVKNQYDSVTMAGRVKDLYRQLIEEKK